LRTIPFAAAVMLAACALGSGKVQTLSRAPSFHAKVLAIAPTRGAGPKGVEIGRALVRRLLAGGVKASSLEDSDSVLAGAAIGLDVGADQRMLDEVRGATGADGLVFLTLDSKWTALDVAVLDAATGEVVLHATARPNGKVFESPDAAASAAAEALAPLAAERHKAAAAAREKAGEIPVPDVGGGD
jgi:hypothetical protein